MPSSSPVIHAWRLVKEERAASSFSGEGAAKFGGRWNSPGTRLVYLAGSPSLALFELMVHARSLEGFRCVLIPVHFQESLVTAPKKLPAQWRAAAAPLETAQMGDRWVREASSAVFRVPSAVMPDEFNYLLNPLHPDYHKIEIDAPRPLHFDRRIESGWRPAYPQ